ncbi:hypothetical protein B0T16DRAFT_418355 [Cercophora newfieldiana]|uniref:Uncharacterized protein n=1 Tax=Cercophora newfieldiana TaxID=92897 RepID=A0AA39XWL2_9PEZI|nr:hypothetical protein B0T16DRAFT_418355 [Cercophora newfieldiana]
MDIEARDHSGPWTPRKLRALTIQELEQLTQQQLRRTNQQLRQNFDDMQERQRKLERDMERARLGGPAAAFHPLRPTPHSAFPSMEQRATNPINTFGPGPQGLSSNAERQFMNMPIPRYPPPMPFLPAPVAPRLAPTHLPTVTVAPGMPPAPLLLPPSLVAPNLTPGVEPKHEPATSQTKAEDLSLLEDKLKSAISRLEADTPTATAAPIAPPAAPPILPPTPSRTKAEDLSLLQDKLKSAISQLQAEQAASWAPLIATRAARSEARRAESEYRVLTSSFPALQQVWETLSSVALIPSATGNNASEAEYRLEAEHDFIRRHSAKIEKWRAAWGKRMKTIYVSARAKIVAQHYPASERRSWLDKLDVIRGFREDSSNKTKSKLWLETVDMTPMTDEQRESLPQRVKYYPPAEGTTWGFDVLPKFDDVWEGGKRVCETVMSSVEGIVSIKAEGD